MKGIVDLHRQFIILAKSCAKLDGDKKFPGVGLWVSAQGIIAKYVPIRYLVISKNDIEISGKGRLKYERTE